MFKATAAVLFAALLAIWATVLLRTLAGVLRGNIFLPPAIPAESPSAGDADEEDPHQRCSR